MGTCLAEVLTPSEPGSAGGRARTRPLTYLAGPGWRESLPDGRRKSRFYSPEHTEPPGHGLDS